MNVFRIGIISFAHVHASAYAAAVQRLPGVELAGIADDNELRGRLAAEQFETKWYRDYADLLRERIDAVIVTSENVRHHEHVLAAANAGKHVLCEKPLAVDIATGREMIDVCRSRGVNLHMAFPCRYNTSVLQAKRWVDEGKIGKLLAASTTNRGKKPGNWFVVPSLSGGGAVMDHTVHVVDLLRWFTGAEVKQVYAETAENVFTDTPIDDCGLLTLDFSDGFFATLDCSWSRPANYPTWGDVTLDLVGTEGTLQVNAFAQNLNVHGATDGFKYSYWGDDMDLAMLADFVDCVRQKRQPSVSGEDGLRAAQVAFSAYESSREKWPVEVK